MRNKLFVSVLVMVAFVLTACTKREEDEVETKVVGVKRSVVEVVESVPNMPSMAQVIEHESDTVEVMTTQKKVAKDSEVDSHQADFADSQFQEDSSAPEPFGVSDIQTEVVQQDPSIPVENIPTSEAPASEAPADVVPDIQQTEAETPPAVPVDKESVAQPPEMQSDLHVEFDED